MKSKKADAPEIVCRTLPDGKDGRRLLTPQELFSLMLDPGMRAAVDLVERVTGCETAVKKTIRTQFKDDYVSNLAVRQQMRAIDLAAKKQRDLKDGKL